MWAMTKITPDHLARSAFVCVRQSTAMQVTHNFRGNRFRLHAFDTTFEVVMDVFPSGTIHCQTVGAGSVSVCSLQTLTCRHVEGARRRWYQPQ